jgi:excisionase family DNA binding protein
MAGMFYSLKEAADRLGKTEDDVKQMAQAGKLRIFRDGSHELFKVDEVNALMAEGIGIEIVEESPGTTTKETTKEESVTKEEPVGKEDSLEIGDLESSSTASEETFDVDEALGLSDQETAPAEPVAEAEASSEISLAPEEPEAEAEGTTAEDELFLLEEDEKPSGSTSQAAEATTGTEEISLAPETGAPASESDITDMDTAMGSEGVNVLGETDTGYDVTEDSMAETVGPAGSTGTAAGTGTGSGAGTGAEASLEEIEDDVNLDSFGSGSGLLDLSLQADDTSLGGILDEIYTSEGGEGVEAPAAAEAGSVEDITAEVEHAGPEEELAAPEAAAVAPVAVPTFAAYVEVPPDTQSNILGLLLFLPLVVLVYTAIVALSARRGVVPSILAPIQGMVWPIMLGAVVLTGILVGASFFMGGERVRAPKKPKEAKVKAKKEKPAKEAKAAKAEAPKEAKPAKGKKGFFGRKKK